MIVDDNAMIHELVREALTPGVDDFADCSDGTEAVALYREYHPDWVLMDIMMEKMDGLKATEAILSEDPHAHIIIITQHNEPSLREKAMRIGAMDFVLKDNLEDIWRIISPQHN
jgi:CheY-like chemotaxis protein